MQYEFTEEEKEVIANTLITIECFDFNKTLPIPYDYINDESQTDLDNVYYHVAWVCEHLRRTFQETKDPMFLEELIRLLPNSYKAVNLHKKRKDKCVNKYFISRYPTQRESDSVPCYEERSCDGCSCFKEKLEKTGEKYAV